MHNVRKPMIFRGADWDKEPEAMPEKWTTSEKFYLSLLLLHYHYYIGHSSAT